MNINRNNYETFFLLYIDNELSVAEKKQVDDFVVANPDLQEELEMFQQSLLNVDDIIFDDKPSLYRKEEDITALQEKLLLHLDGELSFSENAALIATMGADGNIKKELDILQQTKLSAEDKVIFPDKKSLYRKEGGRVVAFPWKRLAIAAALIGVVVMGGIAYLNSSKQADNDGMANADSKKLGKKVIRPEIAPAPVKEDKAAEPVTELAVETPVIKEQEPVNEAIKPTQKSIKRIKGNVEEEAITVKAPNNNLPEPYFNNINKNQRNNTTTAIVTPQKQMDNITDPGNNVIADKKEKAVPSNSFATTAALTENIEENDNAVLFMEEEKVKRTKLGGFLRKAKRVFERNAKIKSEGTNLKVANLEFAIQ